ncbi:hypothetical protein D9758_004769 [Tetrapyrgos nigripes]|uniref:Uncharacterized protein n=1 Tax=Tetrapyrgos nigripes TaxID=182062 RepID=A0A8H5LIU3_9AGAR|nr:hypothetical protein D9758_004769 [Tetrapyrgos nigripes]
MSLGVGAAIPESSASLTRETVRLKGQLVGNKNKRPREEDGETKAHSDSDEGQSKASSIRKKVKHDPFAGTHGKKKKKDLQEPKPTEAEAVAQKSDAANPKDCQAMNRSNPFSVSKLQVSKPDVTLSVPPAMHDEADQQKDSSQSVPSKETEREKSISSEKAIPTSPSQSVTTKPQSPQSPKISRSSVSVLNLDGPVGDDDSGDDEAQASPSKKRRKRRKKKKHAQSILEG